MVRAKKEKSEKQAPAKKVAKSSGEAQGLASVHDYAVLERPVVTEKSSVVGASGSVVTFRVAFKAGKDQIRAAIERIYGVQVSKIRTVNYLGKPKRTASSVGRRAAYKKAYVTLKPGQTINVVEGV